MQDGEVSEEEAKFFMSGSEQFDLDTFKNTGFLLLKPYLDLEKVDEKADEPQLEQDENLEQVLLLFDCMFKDIIGA